MSTATLATPAAVQLTFPWATPDSGSSLRRTPSPTVPAPRQETKRTETVVVEPEPVASVAESLEGDRLCRPIRIGSVMFRLLKSYGITDEEIADGVAAYTAKATTAKAK